MTGLRRFLVEDREPPPPVEHCDLCSTPIPPEHPHLVQLDERRMLCACGPCGFLFDNPGAGAGNYRRVPDRYLADPAFTLSTTDWDALQIPVGLAFFLHNSARGTVVACYPGPAGATESELGLAAWDSGIGASALATELRPDVEALLVRRDPPACLLVPIDACYRLVGLVRTHWRGFDGGAEAWRAIDGCFDELRARAQTLEREA
ncbi:DUF5947 family protein [Pseudonocardia asaccharolytica]|uniref:Uncharacterized protein n=1 Tax=Pseudonocardia asaccharolytica DSM 44247 = NBRC 16224 TaxID=1123024 RepID=A0A511D807_9PSEU|nr:DUF5947 family protein [Pseudonocardia asaccharolytica]GEL20902.1 hypothetical protein PA7_47390 [Pseudonocardia asaccharolytica DSM 44247 = NBRC 16224]